MPIFSTDNYARGQVNTRNVPPGTLIGIPFDTANAPGAGVPAATQLTAVLPDEIRLCWLPPNPIICGYVISIGDCDNGAGLVMELRDGANNVYEAALTTGQAGGLITHATAVVNFIGVPLVLTTAQLYMSLVVTVQAAGANGATVGRFSGVFLVKGNT